MYATFVKTKLKYYFGGLMNKEEYKKYVKKRAKKSPVFKNFCMAFLFGGGICTLGQAFKNLYCALGVDSKLSFTLASITLIFIASILTAFGVFDRIGNLAGAGTLVPITGFANAISSEAIDSKSEGYILGVGSKIFTVAGPVILFGTLSGVVYGIILHLITTYWG